LNATGTTTIEGIVNFKQTCHDVVIDVPATIAIDTESLSIVMEPDLIGNHFGGNPIIGLRNADGTRYS